MKIEAESVAKYEDAQEAFFTGDSPAARILAYMPMSGYTPLSHLVDGIPLGPTALDAEALRDVSLPDFEGQRGDYDAHVAWREYLSQVDVNDGRTPRERLAEVFG